MTGPGGIQRMAGKESRDGGPVPHISGIGIFTAGRPRLLDRALRSYIAQTSSRSREIEYIVFDDSKDSESRHGSFEIARRVGREFNVPVRFSGFEERSRYVRQLQEWSRIPPEILEYALLLQEGYTLGQNRNALLLDTLGSLFFAADDDTVCAPHRAPQVTEEQLKFWAGSDPSEFWCFRDSSEAAACARFVETDYLEDHEQLLGHAFPNNDTDGTGLSTNGSTAGNPTPERPAGDGKKVLVTVNGLLGDCAWGAPFGLWHEPMGYLAFADGSLERLIQSEEFYRQATLSRQVLRLTRGSVVADASFSMLTFCGLDNRDLLPPNLPNHRGQDLIFGQVLWSCFPDAAVGHVPLALLHEPHPRRRFWPGEMTRSAAGVDLCRLIIEALKLCQLHDQAATPELRLRALGRHFADLADLPGDFLEEVLMTSLHESNRRFERKLKEREGRAIERCGFYADDLTRYFAKLHTAEARQDYWKPLDMFSAAGFGSEQRISRAFRQFGQLLDAWPSIVEGAKALRRDGVRVSRPT